MKEEKFCLHGITLPGLSNLNTFSCSLSSIELVVAFKIILTDNTPEEILEAEKNKRQEQFLASLTPEAIASAEVELSSVFSGVLGSLLTNMLSKEPELVQRHLYARRPENNDPTKVQLVQEGLAVPKTSL